MAICNFFICGPVGGGTPEDDYQCTSRRFDHVTTSNSGNVHDFLLFEHDLKLQQFNGIIFFIWDLVLCVVSGICDMYDGQNGRTPYCT